MEKGNEKKFDDLDIETQIKIMLEYIKTLRGGILNTGKLLENTVVNAALDKAYRKLEQLMGIK